MIPLLVGIGAGAGLGYLKNQEAKQQAARDRKTEAEIARWSPWTGMQPSRVSQTSGFSDVLQGGLSGGMLGQNIADAMPASSPVGSISDTTPGYSAPPASGSMGAPAAMSSGTMSAAAPQQSGLSLWGNQQAPAGYNSWNGMNSKYSLYVPAQQGTMLVQK